MIAYFRKFEKKMGQSLGKSPANIVKSLGTISYAEAEEFCRDVRRRYVLAMEEKPLKAIVEERLVLWADRTVSTTF